VGGVRGGGGGPGVGGRGGLRGGVWPGRRGGGVVSGATGEEGWARADVTKGRSEGGLKGSVAQKVWGTVSLPKTKWKDPRRGVRVSYGDVQSFKTKSMFRHKKRSVASGQGPRESAGRLKVAEEV